MIHTRLTGSKNIAKSHDLKLWENNPREVSEKRYEDLKQQIKLGEFKPLLIMHDGTVIGGNMRLRAYRELGIEDIWVSIIEPKKVADGYTAIVNGVEQEKVFNSVEDMMFEYALSDNDNVGKYDQDALANALPQYDIDWDIYNIDFKEGTPLVDLQMGDEMEQEEKEQEGATSYVIQIACEDKEHASDLYEKMTDMGYECRIKMI